MIVDKRMLVCNLIGSAVIVLLLLVLCPIESAMVATICVLVMSTITIVVNGVGVNREHLQHDIGKRLDSEGYKWEMQDGELCVSKGNVSFETVMWDMGVNKKIKRTYFIYRDPCDKLEKVDGYDLARLISITNSVNPHVTIFLDSSDSLCCRFETCVSNVSDFMQEFHVAYNKIGDSLDFFWEHFDLVKKSSLSHSESSVVGFVRNPNSECKSESDNMTDAKKKSNNIHSIPYVKS